MLKKMALFIHDRPKKKKTDLILIIDVKMLD